MLVRLTEAYPSHRMRRAPVQRVGPHLAPVADGFLRNIDGLLVAAGDLKSSPSSNAFRRGTATVLVRASALTPIWPAWPVPLPQVALDNILVSSDLTVGSRHGPCGRL
ncbi:MAG: hypothetical protein J2P51_03255 [Hyphomicrobiaceae bacterium]|nr:hypothetical protein [Hyphomicrobiaceae bacterium]